MSQQPADTTQAAAQPVKKESFFEELKRKLFPKARGRNKSAGSADTAAQPQAAEAAPAFGETTPAGQAPGADVPATTGQSALTEPAPPPAEKKSFMDKIKELFKGKDKPAAADQNTAAATPATERTPEQVMEGVQPATSEPITTPGSTTGATVFDNTTAANPSNQDIVEDVPQELQEIPMVIEKGSDAPGRDK